MGRDRASEFGVRLRELREAAGLTQAQLAERADLHPQAVVKLERGEREPAWSTLLALAEAIGVGVGAFAEPPASAPEERKPGRPPKPLTASEGPKRPRGRPPKAAPAVPSTPPAEELQAEAKAVGRKRKGK